MSSRTTVPIPLILIPPLNFHDSRVPDDTTLLPGVILQEEEKIERESDEPKGAAPDERGVSMPAPSSGSPRNFYFFPISGLLNRHEHIMSFFYRRCGKGCIVDRSLANLSLVSKKMHHLVCSKFGEISRESYRNKDKHRHCLLTRLEEFWELEEDLSLLKRCLSDRSLKGPEIDVKIDIGQQKKLFQTPIEGSFRAIGFLIYNLKTKLYNLPQREYIYRKRIVEENLWTLRTFIQENARRVPLSRKLSPVSPSIDAKARIFSGVVIMNPIERAFEETFEQRRVEVWALQREYSSLQSKILSFKVALKKINDLHVKTLVLTMNYKAVIERYRRVEEVCDRFLKDFSRTGRSLHQEELPELTSEVYKKSYEACQSMIDEIKPLVIKTEKRAIIILNDMQKKIRRAQTCRKTLLTGLCILLIVGITLGTLTSIKGSAI